jgi:SAM-dependent methyltransferase
MPAAAMISSRSSSFQPLTGIAVCWITLLYRCDRGPEVNFPQDLPAYENWESRELLHGGIGSQRPKWVFWMELRMTLYAEAYYREKLFDLVSPDTEWLDLGCGHQILPTWLKNSAPDQKHLSSRCKRLVGIDAVVADVARHPYLHERVVGDIQRLPFEENSFSLLTARSVIEHIEAPAAFLGEVQRVLKPGGRFLFATPNYRYYQLFVASVTPELLKKRLVFFLEGRAEQDVFKTYYRMNTTSGISKIARGAGMTIESLETIECLPEFGRLGRLIVALEKAITAALRCVWLRSFRAVIVAVLRKPAMVDKPARVA